MLKAVAGNILILGLSKMNVERLQEGQPVLFDATAFGFPGKQILITYGETETTIKADLDAMLREKS